MDAVSIAVGLGLATLCGVVIPVLAVRGLMPALEAGALKTRNYRKRLLPVGLGIVWIVWAFGLLAAQALLDVAYRLSSTSAESVGLLERLVATPLTFPLYALPFMLVTGMAALGLIDDAYGAGGPKGFGGHLGALAQGRLTTGGLKLLGGGGLSAFYGAAVASSVIERSNVAESAVSETGAFLLAWVSATLVIALSANLMNLLDLRPGRALKVYSLAVIAPAVMVALGAIDAYNAEMARYVGETGTLLFAGADRVTLVVATLVVVLGPVAAMWRYDLGEQAMLGDAGANAMGAIVGYLLAMSLSLAGMVVAAVLLLGFNLLSERVSLSALIEGFSPLAWLDRLGRTKV